MKGILVLFLAYWQQLVAAEDEPSCFGYITGSDTFRNDTGPLPIQCGSSVFGDAWGPNEHQELSCCSGGGRYFVQTGQIGGFDASYSGRNGFGEADARCSAYTSALMAILCDPQQGNFVFNDTLRVCRSSCDAVYDACGPPGDIFADSANYTNGTSVCLDLWGGFGSSNPCQGRPDGFPCLTGLRIEVVDSDCLALIEPSDKVLKHYEEEQSAPDPCNNDANFSVGALVGILLGFFAILTTGAFVIWDRRRKHLKELELAPRPVVDASVIFNLARLDEDPDVVLELDSNEPPETLLARPLPEKPANPTEKPCVQAYPKKSLSKRKVRSSRLVAIAETDEGDPASVSSLVASVKEAATYERSNAIRQWIQDHPSQAANLTPKEVADVLEYVTFSLDQTAAATEIAWGMGNAMTCAHVATVLSRCKSTNKADIAKVMVIHIRDPENKDQVLNEIESLFGREEVSRHFPN